MRVENKGQRRWENDILEAARRNLEKVNGMIAQNPIFNLRLSNLPIINIRQEFRSYMMLLSNEEFVRKLHNVRDPIEMPLFVWRDLPKNLLTYMLQRSILGVESCISAAVEFQVLTRGRLDEKMAAALNDPTKLPGARGMAEVFYNNMPAQVDPALQLKLMEPDLWVTVHRFYKEVRNPLFHGYHLDGLQVSEVLEAMAMIQKVYAWMDPWWGVFRAVDRPDR